MDRFRVYIPNLSAPEHVALAWIEPKSAIVGSPEPAGDELLIYFEGNRYRALNMVTFADRAREAADRLAVNYPTIAKTMVTRRALTQIGWFTPGHGVDVPDGPSLVALAEWLDLLDGEHFDSDALHAELRLSQ
jgi:hypothetical protein